MGLQTIAQLPQWRSTCLVKGAGLSDSKMKVLRNESAALVGTRRVGLGLLSAMQKTQQQSERNLVGLLLLFSSNALLLLLVLLLLLLLL